MSIQRECCGSIKLTVIAQSSQLKLFFTNKFATKVKQNIEI